MSSLPPPPEITSGPGVPKMVSLPVVPTIVVVRPPQLPGVEVVVLVCGTVDVVVVGWVDVVGRSVVLVDVDVVGNIVVLVDVDVGGGSVVLVEVDVVEVVVPPANERWCWPAVNGDEVVA